MRRTEKRYEHSRSISPTTGCLIVAMLAIADVHAAPEIDTPRSDADAIADLTRPTSQVEIGALVLSDGNFASGNYGGLDRRGGYLLGSFDLRGDQYRYGNSNDDKTRWRLTGNNLGFASRSLAGEYGRQGTYRITFGYDEFSRLNTDSYQTPFVGAGTSNLTLPAGFIRGNDTSGMTLLADSMRRFDIASMRQRTELGAIYALNTDWELRASLRNEKRDGNRVRGAEFGSSGGNARSQPLPEPIDSVTQLIDLSLAFNGDDKRLTVGYHGSVFRNDVSSITWQNPFNSSIWTGSTTGLPAGFPIATGQTAVAPDNQFHQLSASGVYDFSTTTRVTLTGTRGRMTQNDAFLPYTINPGLSIMPLPRASLNGLVETTFLNGKLSMRPLRALSVNATFRHEDRENKTPQSQYAYVDGDVQLQPALATDSERIRTNLPRSRRQQVVSVDADCRLNTDIAIKAAWDQESVKRTFQEVERTTEDTYRIEIRRASAGELSANASFAKMVRRGSTYLYNLPYLASYTSPAYINGLLTENGCTNASDCVRNAPLQTKFFLADRDRERSRVMFGFAPEGALSVNARLDVNRNRYPHSPYGVNNTNSWSASADIGYLFNEDFTATLFYTFESQFSRERTRQILSANTAIASSANSDWINEFADKTASIGFALRYKGLLGGRLELNADAIAVRGRSPINTTVGPAVPAGQNPATPFPDLTTHSDEAHLSARYALDRQSTMRFQYFYRHLSTADWAYQQVFFNTLANVIGTNEISPRYTQHGVGISYLRSFR